VWLRSSFFCGVTQCILIVVHPAFRDLRCPETSVKNYKSTLCTNLGGAGSQAEKTVLSVYRFGL